MFSTGNVQQLLFSGRFYVVIIKVYILGIFIEVIILSSNQQRHSVPQCLSINQSNLVFVKRHLNKVLRGASYE